MAEVNICIANDAVPVFYCYVVAICYVVVKSFFLFSIFLKRTSNFDKLKGGVGDLLGRSYKLLLLDSW